MNCIKAYKLKKAPNRQPRSVVCATAGAVGDGGENEMSGVKMNQSWLVLALIASLGTAAHADEVPASAALSTQQGQARQFGIFYGGTASQYDLCVKKGFLARGDQSAEEIAKSMLEKVMRASNIGPDLSPYVQDGWDTMKREVSQHETFYTQEKCSGVGKEWAKMIAAMRSKRLNSF
jgi:hypothetical protein